jgi:hypothetical protein
MVTLLHFTVCTRLTLNGLPQSLNDWINYIRFSPNYIVSRINAGLLRFNGHSTTSHLTFTINSTGRGSWEWRLLVLGQDLAISERRFAFAPRQRRVVHAYLGVNPYFRRQGIARTISGTLSHYI